MVSDIVTPSAEQCSIMKVQVLEVKPANAPHRVNAICGKKTLSYADICDCLLILKAVNKCQTYHVLLFRPSSGNICHFRELVLANR
jgi:hypothetical protein